MVIVILVLIGIQATYTSGYTHYGMNPYHRFLIIPLEEECPSECNKTIIIDSSYDGETLEWSSPGWTEGNNYPPDCVCVLTVEVKTAAIIQTTFNRSSVIVGIPWSCLNDSLYFTDITSGSSEYPFDTAFCGYLGYLATSVTNRGPDDLIFTITFNSTEANGDPKDAGFNLMLTPTILQVPTTSPIPTTTTPKPTTTTPKPTTTTPKPTTRSPKLICPSGYTEVETGYTKKDSQCFSFNTWSKKTWHQSKQECQRAGARLAEPKDAKKLEQYLLTYYRGKIFWLGASDAGHEGQWRWLGGRHVNGGIWRTGEPNNAGSGEDCMMWWGLQDAGGGPGYHDQFCTDSYNYICEADKVLRYFG